MRLRPRVKALGSRLPRSQGTVSPPGLGDLAVALYFPAAGDKNKARPHLPPGRSPQWSPSARSAHPSTAPHFFHSISNGNTCRFGVSPSTSEYSSVQRVMGRVASTPEVTEAPDQPSSVKSLNTIYSDSHSVTDRTYVRPSPPRKWSSAAIGNHYTSQFLNISVFGLMTILGLDPKYFWENRFFPFITVSYQTSDIGHRLESGVTAGSGDGLARRHGARPDVDPDSNRTSPGMTEEMSRACGPSSILCNPLSKGARPSP